MKLDSNLDSYKTTKGNKLNRLLNFKHLLVERTDVPILLRDSHTRQILWVSRRLEITTAYEKVNFESTFFFHILNSIINFLQFSVSTSFNSNLHD